MATPPKVQIKRTAISNNPPTGLLEGELSVEMGTPTRLWVGVPVGIDASGRKLIIDVSAPGTQFVDVTGDTMTGPLILSGPPTVDNGAANKKYVDDLVGGGETAFVNVSGDTMTGPLVLPGAPTIDLHASTKKYTDDLVNALAAALAATYVDVGGDTMTGALTVPHPPTADNHAATKKYIDDALTSGGAGVPSGTVMVFYQAAAPTGWTKITTQNDKALRVVSGAGGVAGGTNPFSTVNAQTVVGSMTPSVTTMAAHTHTVSDPTHSHTYVHSGGGATQPGASNGGVLVGTVATSASYTGVTLYSNGSGSAHNHTINMAMQYIDVILASRN